MEVSRMSRICLPVALLLAGSFPLLAQVAAPKSGGAEVQKVYAVAELVVPCNTPPARAHDGCFLPCCTEAGLWTAQLAASSNTTEDKLIKLITSTVRPGCWAENGGRCTIEYFPIGLGLVVHAPDDVPHDVAHLPDALRE